MYPRVNYEMTEDDLKEIMESCAPVPYIVLGGYAPLTPQENANRAWQRLGEKMGFDHMTVRPINGKSPKFFSAVPNETESQKETRLKTESETKRQTEIRRLETEIEQAQERLIELRTGGRPCTK